MKTEAKTKWNIDTTHSEITFRVKHLMISTVTGYFDNYEASVEASDNKFSDAQFEFTAQISSVNTKNKDRDEHLKSEDFFNAAMYPEMTFNSTSYNGDSIVGDLTIKEVTKSVKLGVEFNGVVVDPYGQTKAGFEFTGQLNRKNFGLSWNAVTDAGSIVVSDTVKLNLQLQFIKQ